MNKLLNCIKKNIGYILLTTLIIILFAICVLNNKIVITVSVIDILVLILTLIGTIILVKDYNSRMAIARKKYETIEKFENGQPLALLFFFDGIQNIDGKSFFKDAEEHIHDFDQILETIQIISDGYDEVFNLHYRNEKMIKKISDYFDLKINLKKMINMFEMSKTISGKQRDRIHEDFLQVAKDSGEKFRVTLHDNK